MHGVIIKASNLSLRKAPRLILIYIIVDLLSSVVPAFHNVLWRREVTRHITVMKVWAEITLKGKDREKALQCRLSV